MERLITLLAAVLLTACGGGGESTTPPPTADLPTEPPTDPLYIVSGQSNATNCDWSYFEDLTGAKVVNIAKSGYPIDWLIDEYHPDEVEGADATAIIFVHGEADSMNNTPADYYAERVEVLRSMISLDVNRQLPIYLSTVGYYDKFPDANFDRIRDGVKQYAATNGNWSIAYDGAQYFRDWGLLYDGIHFNEDGCQLMMENVAGAL